MFLAWQNTWQTHAIHGSCECAGLIWCKGRRKLSGGGSCRSAPQLTAKLCSQYFWTKTVQPSDCICEISCQGLYSRRGFCPVANPKCHVGNRTTTKKKAFPSRLSSTQSDFLQCCDAAVVFTLYVARSCQVFLTKIVGTL